MQSSVKVTILFTLPVVLSGCFGFGEKPGSEAEDRYIQQLSVCELLDDNDEWIEPALKARKRYGTPVHLSLALLELPLSDLDKKHIRPRISDWDEYRIRSEHWAASPHEPEDALDFVGWFTKETNKRNKTNWDNAKGHYLALRLGHGGYERFEAEKFSQLEQQAYQVGRRAERWKQELAGCKETWQSESWLQSIKLW